MKNLKTFIPFIFILTTTFIGNFLGIQWGLPGKNTMKLLMGNEEEILEQLLPEMVKARKEIREMVKYSTQEYRHDYNENQIVVNIHNKIPITLAKINAMRTYFLRTYYPDEHVTIIALSHINLKRKEFSPKTPVPGSFYIYSAGLWLGVCKSLNLIKLTNDTNDISFYISHPWEIGKIYLSIRVFLILTMLFSTYIVWKIGNEFGRDIAFFSAFLYGISPVLNLWNHFGYYYGFAIPFIMLSFLFSLKILNEDRLKYYIIAGISAGLATSVFIPYLLSGIFIFWAGCIRFLKKKSFMRSFKYTTIGITFLFIVFAVIHIFLLLDKEIMSATIKNGAGDFKFSFQPFYFLFASLKSAVGWPFLISAIGGYILIIFKKREEKETFLLLSFVVPFLVFSSFSPWYTRRGIFLIPFMAIFAGVFLTEIRKNFKLLGNIIVFFVLAWTFLYSISYTRIFMQKNIRDIAGEWINENIPEKAKIGLLQMPAPYRTPPFQFYRYRLVPILWNKELLEKEKPEYFIISEYEMLWQKESDIKNFFAEYYILKHFKQLASIMGITFNRTKFSAKDFWPPNPDIIIYRRKNVEE